MLICNLDAYSLYSMQTHKSVSVKQTSPYHIERKSDKLINVGHAGKVRAYRYNRTEKGTYRLYHSGDYILIYDTKTDLYYLKKVGKIYTIPMNCEKETP